MRGMGELPVLRVLAFKDRRAAYPTKGKTMRKLGTAAACWLVMLVAQAWLPAEDSVEGQYLSNVRQVTSGFVKAGEGYFSPDGKQIIYQAVPQEYPFYQIYTQPLAGGEPKLVSTGRGRTTCSYFSPDGKRILYSSSHLDPQLDKTEAAERAQQEADKKAGVRRRYKWDFDPHTDIFEADLQGRDDHHARQRQTGRDGRGLQAQRR